MPRANRHYIPGQVWHITHRCHKKEFLLKFRKDRKRWQHWLFKAKKRFGLQILNYIDEIKNILGIKATGRRKSISQDACELREPTSPYSDTLIPERVTLRQENMHYWNI